MPIEVHKGQSVRVSGAFTLVGAAADPATAIIKYKAPGVATVTKTYPTDAEVIRSGVGNYYMEIPMGTIGRWWVRVESTGTVVATSEDFVDVIDTEL